MSDIIDRRNKAQELREQEKYSEALLLYKELWESTSPQDKWDGWGYALCLNKIKNYSTALEVSRKVLEIDNKFEYIQGNLPGPLI